MTDDRTLADLDARGRAAGAGVRTAVADRPVPVFDPDLVRIDVDARPERTRRSRPVVAVLAAAAAVLVVVAAVVALMGNGDPDSTPTDRVAPGDLDRYVLAAPPDGWTLRGVYDASEPAAPPEGEMTTFGPLAVYGVDADHPAVAVSVIPDMTDEGLTAESRLSPADEVGGRRVWRDDRRAGSIVVEVDDAFVSIEGAPADRDQVDAVAAAVTVDGDRADVAPDALPAGWRHLGDGHVFDLFPGTAGMATEDAGSARWIAGYSTPVEGQITVSVSGGDPVRARIPTLAAEDTEVVDVRGHEAVLTRTIQGDDHTRPTVAVTWEERPGEVVQVSTWPGLDDDEVVELAREVVRVDVEDVPDLRRQAFEAELTAPDIALIGRGTFVDGVSWALVVHDDEWVDLLSDAQPGRASSSGMGTATGAGRDDGTDPPAPFEGYMVGEDGSLRYGWGVIDDRLAAVELRDARSDEAVAEAEIVEGAGRRAWVARLPDDGYVDGVGLVLVGFDAAGTETASYEIEPLG